MINLRLPLRNIQVNQPFGVNYLDFYAKLGLKGHNGIDFRAMDGFICYAAHGGKVTYAGINPNDVNLLNGKPAIEIEIMHPTLLYKTLYYHLQDISKEDGTNLQVGETVIAGTPIGHCDNTGAMTTGSHLHFGLKQIDANGNTLNYDNGFKGAIDPASYFTMAYNGFILEDKFDACNALQRYYRADRRNLGNEVKVAVTLSAFLKRLPNNEQIKACVYGGWDREAVANIALRDNWAFIKKIEMETGIKPFQN